MTSPRPRPDPWVQRSRRLQRLLRRAGYGRGDGVSAAGLLWLRRMARSHGLPDWPDISTLAEYDALIRVAREFIHPQPRKNL